MNEAVTVVNRLAIYKWISRHNPCPGLVCMYNMCFVLSYMFFTILQNVILYYIVDVNELELTQSSNLHCVTII